MRRQATNITMCRRADHSLEKSDDGFEHKRRRFRSRDGQQQPMIKEAVSSLLCQSERREHVHHKGKAKRFRGQMGRRRRQEGLR